MNPEKIEKALTSAWRALEEDTTGEITPLSIAIPLMQLQLLLDIYKKLVSIDEALTILMRGAMKNE